MTSTISEAALFLNGWLELSILSKATILLVLGLAASSLARRGRASVRHVVLAATFAALLALPLIVLAVPSFKIEVPVRYRSVQLSAASVASPSQNVARPLDVKPGRSAGIVGSLPSWIAMVRGMWIAGAILFLMPLATHLYRMRRLHRDGLPWREVRERMPSLLAECGVGRSVEVVLHEEIPAPLTYGWVKPIIVLPFDARSWGEAELRCALIHELEHVRRLDWATQVVTRAICACYWFHPLVWVAWRRLSLEAERACDDAVVRSEERTDYAEQLVSLAQRMSKTHAQPLLGMANRSDLSTRVSAVLDRSQPRGPASPLAAASAIIASVLVVLAIAPIRAVAQSPSTRVRRSNPLDRALYEAAEEGDLSGIDRLLVAGADANGTLPGDGSPLIGAARKGQLAAVQLLLDRGADPNKPVPGDGNPLIMAARQGHVDVVTLLLDRGARIDEVVPGDENALIQASGSGRLETVKLLVSRRADVNARVWVQEMSLFGAVGEWRTPLSMARRGRHAAVVAVLQSAGARE